MGLDTILSPGFIDGVLRGMLTMAVPLLLGSLGEIFVQRSGNVNLGLEGQMLISSFIAFVGTFYFQSPFLGILCALLFGAMVGLFMSYMTINLGANMIIIGVVMNIFAVGFTSFFFRYFLGASLMPPTIVRMTPMPIPLLNQLPGIGFVFNQNLMVYMALLAVPLCSFVLFRTNIGLKIRTVGGNAEAADTMGISVVRIRYLTWIIGALMASLAGAFLSLNVGMFADGMSANRGFICIALVMFSRWKPLYALAGALLFGLADGLQLRFQALSVGVPYQFLVMLPYVLTVAVMVISARFKFINPSVIGQPYQRESKETQ